MNAFAALGVAEDLTALLKLQGIKMPTPHPAGFHPVHF